MEEMRHKIGVPPRGASKKPNFRYENSKWWGSLLLYDEIIHINGIF